MPAAWVCSCAGLCRTQIPRNSLFKLRAWYSWYSTATRLDLHLECYLCQTSLELNTSREPEPGPSCMQSCFEELCGRAFSPAYVMSVCLQSVSGSAVWIQAWRAPCPHSDTTRFWPSFRRISAPVFLCPFLPGPPEVLPYTSPMLLQRPKHTSQGDHRRLLWSRQFNNSTHLAPMLHPLAMLCYIHWLCLELWGHMAVHAEDAVIDSHSVSGACPWGWGT